MKFEPFSKQPAAYLGLTDWQHTDFFTPTSQPVLHPVIAEIEDHIKSVNLEGHSFFEYAKTSKDALKLWVSQELVVTNAFSQIVLNAASHVKNVHIRAIFAEVAFTEHGISRKGTAVKSHPWLLNMLRHSIGINENNIKPSMAAIDFLSYLDGCSNDPIAAIAAIGVGNERMIVPEYNMIKICFQTIWPEASHAPFLDANINEDITHANLCYLAASMLIKNEFDAKKYKETAFKSIKSRFDYYDELVSMIESGVDISVR